ncbi:MAG: hypothetical protein WD491_11485 [Balneolales bacterium]
MSDSKANIKFSYLYRDGGNYKQFGYIIFSRNSKEFVEELERQLRSQLIEGMNFVASDWGVPELHAYPYDEDLDHGWHEFEGLEETEEEVNDDRTIEAFLGMVNKKSK